MKLTRRDGMKKFFGLILLCIWTPLAFAQALDSREPAATAACKYADTNYNVGTLLPVGELILVCVKRERGAHQEYEQRAFIWQQASEMNEAYFHILHLLNNFPRDLPW